VVPESALPEQLSGVGATALGVARLRAMEDARPDRLVADPYAGDILAAAAATGSPWAAVSPQAGPDFFALMADQVAVHSRFLDLTLLRLTRAGCAQVVLLACGMDTRAFRLDWPAHTRVFEVDFGEVLAFRDAALASHGRLPCCDRVGVSADLRQDWPTALRSAGFNPTQTTAWLAEGILYALAPDATDTLLDRITELSAPGSTLALDHVEDSPYLRAARTAVSPRRRRHRRQPRLARHRDPARSAHPMTTDHTSSPHPASPAGDVGSFLTSRDQRSQPGRSGACSRSGPSRCPQRGIREEKPTQTRIPGRR